jgi:hypothetical protein
MNPRTIKSKNSPRTIITALAIGILLLGFILFAVFPSGSGILDAKKSGVLVGKEFVPQPERQITLGEEGSISARDKEGEYLLTVEVPNVGGKKYTVWVNKKLYESLQVGDKFDVGAYLTPEKN